jgi:hypothetical protein
MVIYNYFKIITSDGEMIGVGAAEKGSSNEVFVIEAIMEYGYTVVKIDKDEYDAYDDHETYDF